jgi:hypothetical protein
MTIGAYSGFLDPLGSRLLVGAVKRPLVLTGVTALAGGVELKIEVSTVLGNKGRVRVVT